jgi:hypothetical protein
MKLLATTLAMALGFAAGADPALAESAAEQAGTICLNVAQIDHTKVVDDNTILFYLKGGKVLRNTLAGRCVGLHIATRGFTYLARNDEVCGNLQTLRVNDTGIICELGPFTPEPPKP